MPEEQKFLPERDAIAFLENAEMVGGHALKDFFVDGAHGFGGDEGAGV